MGLKPIVYYTALCDEPGCDADLVDDHTDEYGSTTLPELHIMAGDAEWQQIPIGATTYWYCDKHHREGLQPTPDVNDPTELPPPLFTIETP
ncbi:hypothetical protein AS850_02815 [Frondihabitans sp. 762G35]|uniref:hypothetical protein n=1 Tax=Frondihabitans sp. 762G35 TaxID=1446794 RepID=UPI000D224322|nr:hypothetical protein [Frondihabitans sp. 762G35]ARC56004.1 hypothetical protein AS850_02815 [Frondihabitans sp. 762G35]